MKTAPTGFIFTHYDEVFKRAGHAPVLDGSRLQAEASEMFLRFSIPTWVYLSFLTDCRRGLGTAFSVARKVVLLLVLVVTPSSAQDLAPKISGVDKALSDQDAVVWRFGRTGAESESNGYYLLQFSPDGKFLAARNRDNVVELWNTVSRKQLCQVDGHEARILGVEFSPDSRFFITSAPGVDEKTKVWETQTGALALALPMDARAAHFSSKGDSLVLLGDKQVKRFAWPGGRELSSKTWATGSDQPAAVSRDGRIVASYRSINNSLFQCHLTDVETGSQILLEGPNGPAFFPRNILISPNKQFLAANFIRESKIGLWDLRDPEESSYQLIGHDDRVQSIAFSADDRFLISTSWDKTSIVWDLLTREAVHRIEGHSESVNSSAFSPLGLQLATGASGQTDSSVMVWDFSQFLFPESPTPVAEESFNTYWRQLGSALAAPSLKAVNDLRHSHELMMPLLTERVGVFDNAVSQEVIQSWINSLDDSSFSVREQATEELLKIRGRADALLRETLRKTTRSEVRYRITKILGTPISRPKMNLTELRRLHRTVFLLELIADQPARDLLQLIATQHPHADISEAAAAAVDRLRRQ